MVNCADLPGVLAGRYEPRARLGADTLRAWDKQRRREVVIETYAGPRAGADAIARHAAAIAAARRAAQPSLILPIELVSEGAGAPFAVFEPPVGQDLAALQREAGALLWARAAEITAQCAQVLAAVAKATGLAHRGLGPGKVWISASGEVKLLGFGAAEFGRAPAGPRADGSFAEYRAPEQLDGSAGDARSDVHALGVLLFEMTTGVHPFAADSAFKAAHNLLMQPAPALASVVSGLPEAAMRAADGVIQRALARRPDDRFTSVEELGRALELARRTVGSPVHRVAPPRTPAPVVKAAPVPIEDPTTMLSLRVMRDVSPAPRVAPAVAEPVTALVTPPVVVEEVVERTELHPRIVAQRAPVPARSPVLEALPRPRATATVDATEQLVQGTRPRPEATLKLVEGPGSRGSLDEAATTLHRRGDVAARAADPEATRLGPYRPPAALQVASESAVADAEASRSADVSRSKLGPAEPGLWGSNRLLIALNVLCGVLIVVGLVLLWAT